MELKYKPILINDTIYMWVKDTVKSLMGRDQTVIAGPTFTLTAIEAEIYSDFSYLLSPLDEVKEISEEEFNNKLNEAIEKVWYELR